MLVSRSLYHLIARHGVATSDDPPEVTESSNFLSPTTYSFPRGPLRQLELDPIQVPEMRPFRFPTIYSRDEDYWAYRRFINQTCSNLPSTSFSKKFHLPSESIDANVVITALNILTESISDSSLIRCLEYLIRTQALNNRILYSELKSILIDRSQNLRGNKN